MVSSQRLLNVLQRFAVTMLDPFETNDVLYELSDNAVSVLEAAGAGVSVVTSDDKLRFVTATSEAVLEIEQTQERHQAGPWVQAYNTGKPVTIADISQLDQWPEYRQTAANAGFAAVVGLSLAVGDRRIGSLNVYDTKTRHWTDDDLQAAEVLSDIATAYILRAGELIEAQQLSHQLQHALDSRIVIEQAKGMLARDHNLTVDQAFELLRTHSRNTNTALRTIAHAVVELDLHLPRP